MTISQKIKAIRTHKEITQADIARAIGVERTSYHRLENRDDKLTVEQLRKIAGALGVSAAELIDEEPYLVKSDGSDQKGRRVDQEEWELKEEGSRLRSKLITALFESNERAKEAITQQVESHLLKVSNSLGVGQTLEISQPTDKEHSQPANDSYRILHKQFNSRDFLRIALYLFEFEPTYFMLINTLIDHSRIDTNPLYVKALTTLRQKIVSEDVYINDEKLTQLLRAFGFTTEHIHTH